MQYCGNYAILNVVSLLLFLREIGYFAKDYEFSS